MEREPGRALRVDQWRPSKVAVVVSRSTLAFEVYLCVLVGLKKSPREAD